MPRRARRARAQREPRESALRAVLPAIAEVAPAARGSAPGAAREVLAQAADLLSAPESSAARLPRARSLNAMQRALGNGFVAGRTGQGETGRGGDVLATGGLA